MNEVGRTPGSNRKTGEALPALEDNKALKCLGPPPLVEGEDADAYQNLLAMVCAERQPVDIIDWIYVRDMVDLQWDALRYRRSKAHLITPPRKTWLTFPHITSCRTAA